MGIGQSEFAILLGLLVQNLMLDERLQGFHQGQQVALLENAYQHASVFAAGHLEVTTDTFQRFDAASMCRDRLQHRRPRIDIAGGVEGQVLAGVLGLATQRPGSVQLFPDVARARVLGQCVVPDELMHKFLTCDPGPTHGGNG